MPFSREPWRQSRHLWHEACELIPVRLAAALRNPKPAPTTNLEDGTLVDMPKLWADICQNGLRDPVILRIGLESRTWRLDVGNHRILVLAAHGVRVVPAVCVLGRHCIGEPGNGLHSFDAPPGELLLPKLTLVGATVIVPPSQTLRSCIDAVPFDCRSPYFPTPETP